MPRERIPLQQLSYVFLGVATSPVLECHCYLIQQEEPFVDRPSNFECIVAKLLLGSSFRVPHPGLLFDKVTERALAVKRLDV